jgi:hypothetical protein
MGMDELIAFVKARIDEDEASGADLTGIRWFIAERDRVAADLAVHGRASSEHVTNAVKEIAYIWCDYPGYRAEWKPASEMRT